MDFNDYSNCTPYDRRLVSDPFVKLRAIPAQDEDNFDYCPTLIGEVIEPAEPNVLRLRDITWDMVFDVESDGTLSIVDPGKASPADVVDYSQRHYGLQWQGDLPSAVRSSAEDAASYIEWERSTVGDGIGSLEDLRILIERDLVEGMANQLEALLPLLRDAKGENDLGHSALINSMINQARRVL